MTKYETMFILSSALDEEAAKATAEKFTSLIAENGTVEKVDEWGKRRLAYPINDEQLGIYYLVLFESEPEFPAELDRIFKITDGVLRSMIIKREE